MKGKLNRIKRSRAAAAALTASMILPSARAGLVYESATLGPTGVAAGNSINSNQFLGVRFELIAPVTVDRLGGHFGSGLIPSSTTFFGALVKLSGGGDFPDSSTMTTPDVVAAARLIVPSTSADLVENFTPTPLAAGWYALVYGSGPFATSGAGFAPSNNTNVGMPSFIQYSTAGGWQNGGGSGLRFLVAGASNKVWNGSSGNWNTAANWSPGGVPESFNDAIFGDLLTTYTVDLSDNATVHDITNQFSTVTLALSGHTLTSTGQISIATDPAFGATLNLQNGTLARPTTHEIIVGDQGSGTLNVSNNAVIDGYAASVLTVGRHHDGTLTITNGSVNTLYGRVAFDPSADSGVTTGSGTVTINSGGIWYIAQNLIVGRNGPAVVEINGGGQLNIANALTAFNAVSGTEVRLSGGTLRAKYLEFTNPSHFKWTTGSLVLGDPLEVISSGMLGDNINLGPGKSLFCTTNPTHIYAGGQFSVTGGLFSGFGTNDGTFSQTAGQAYFGGDNGLTGNGTTTVTGGSLYTLRVRQQSLTIGGTGSVNLTLNDPNSPTTTSRLGPFSITGSGKLDLSKNKLIATTGDVGSWNGTAYTGITGWIQSGRNGGPPGSKWAGPGIVTSETAATTSNLTSIAIATAGQVKGIGPGTSGVWSGEFVSSQNILIMYTYGGDANLDGKINVDDYGHIDSSIGIGLTGWFNGDFNYDGKINVDDYGIIDFNIGIQGASFPTGGVASPASVTAVPEPAAAALFLAGLSVAVPAGRHRRGAPAKLPATTGPASPASPVRN